jgi:hypothetical protein
MLYRRSAAMSESARKSSHVRCREKLLLKGDDRAAVGNLDKQRKLAKDLSRDYWRGKPEAIERAPRPCTYQPFPNPGLLGFSRRDGFESRWIMAEVSAIAILYETLDDGSQGERTYSGELKAWLPRQPQDAWFMVVKNMNWDSMDSLTDFMIDDRDCDIAIIASIFWAFWPGWHVANEGSSNEARIARIVANVDRGFYRRSELALNRFEVLYSVHDYSDAVRARRFTQQPPRITLPRVLLGPFVGREPAMVRGNEATERHLDEIIHALGSSHFFRTQAAWRDAYESNYWIRHYFTLPPLTSSSTRELRNLDELAHIEALYGTTAAYMDARRRLEADGEPGWATRLRGNRQFYEGV